MAEENKVESGVVLPPADFTGQLQKEAQEMGVALNEHQIKQFYDYYELLIHWNTMVNLTAITEQKEVVTKHFSDSLALVKAVPDLAEKEYTLIDVGTGAGFPGIPLKIAFPNLKVTLLDSLNKRINFLNEVIQALELEKIQAVHGRAEDDDARDALERHGLAAARGAQERQRLAGVRHLEGDVEVKAGEVPADVDGKAHRAPPAPLTRRGREARRTSVLLLCSNQFMARRTTAEMARFTMTHARAPASSPVRVRCVKGG